MIREIKFRAWEGNKMVYFDLYDLVMWSPNQVLFKEGSTFSQYESIPKRKEGVILMRFTGLLDKSGKEIYEGDVVKLKKFIGGNWVDHKIQICTVVFDKFSFQLKPIDGATYTVSMVLGYDCEIEIIGNIYEITQKRGGIVEETKIRIQDLLDEALLDEACRKAYAKTSKDKEVTNEELSNIMSVTWRDYALSQTHIGKEAAAKDIVKLIADQLLIKFHVEKR